MHYHIKLGTAGRFALDLPEFARRLAARWPGGTVVPDPAPLGAPPGHVWYFTWPRHPLHPVRDRTIPGEIRWLAKQEGETAPDGSTRYLSLPELAATPAYVWLMPEPGMISFFDTSPLDCAICAVWLRRWLPLRTPIVVGPEDMCDVVRVEAGMTLNDVLQRLLGIGHSDPELSLGEVLRYDRRTETPKDPISNEAVAEFVRRVEELPESKPAPEDRQG